MSEGYKIRIVNEVVRRLWDRDPETAVTPKASLAEMWHPGLSTRANKLALQQRYMNETECIKNIMLAIVKDIGYAMNELDLGDEKAVAFNDCKLDLARAVDEYNRLTHDGYEQTFRPRLNCVVQSLKLVDEGGETKKRYVYLSFPR